MILFINACVRRESRTRRLAEAVIGRWGEAVTEVRLQDIPFPVADEAFLKARDRLIDRQEFGDPMFDLARQFAAADRIVIASPFWDLSFPAALKQYFEQINVVGITFRYTPEGVPQGLCRAESLCYVTTAGGPIFDDAFGFGYVRALAQGYYGIQDVRYLKAEGLDVVGADVEGIIRGAMETIDQAAGSRQ